MNLYCSQIRNPRLSPAFLPVFESMEGRQLLSALLGTSGDDHIVLTFDSATGDITVNGAANVADGTVFAKTERFNIDAGGGNDYIEFSPASGAAAGYPGSASNSTIRGGAGDDQIIISSANMLYIDGGAGNDQITANGHGLYTLQFADAVHGVRVRLDQGKVLDDGTGGQDTITGIRVIDGSPFDDVLYGADNTNYLSGRDGNDLIVAAAQGNGAQLDGNDGDDTIKGSDGGGNVFAPGRGDDVVLAGGRQDTLRYYDNELSTGVVVRLGRGLVRDGSGGTDHISGIENLQVYSDFDDTIFGDAGDNYIYAGGGDNLIYGLGGDDHIVADQGIILGGPGNDVIATNGSLVYIDGGTGKDEIALWGPKFAIEKIILDSEDSLTDNRYAPDSSQVSPGPNTLMPPNRIRVRSSGWNCLDRRWVLA